MKTIIRFTFGLITFAVLIIASGCATSEKPNYQGHKGVSPTVQDYYPSQEKK